MIIGQEKNFSFGVNAHKRYDNTYEKLIISLHAGYSQRAEACGNSCNIVNFWYNKCQ